MRLPVVLGGITLHFALLAVTASAQSVAGRVTDETTGRAVAGATVRLLNPAGQQSAVATTSRTGSWAIQAPTPGTYYRIQVERVGYARIETDPFLVGTASARVDLSTRPEVVVLEEVSAQTLNYAGLLDRSTTRKSARTLLPEDVASRIQRLRPGNTGQLVRSLIAGLGLTWDDWPRFESVALMNWEVASRGRTFAGGEDFRSPWDHSPPLSSRRACTAVVAVDGIPHVKNRPQATLERLVPLTEVRAVEIFHDPNFLPKELELVSKMNKLDIAPPPAPPIPCGVVAIWTREGIGVP
jgi:hypothetical protein